MDEEEVTEEAEDVVVETGLQPLDQLDKQILKVKKRISEW